MNAIPAILLLTTRVAAIEVLEITIITDLSPQRVDHPVATDHFYLFAAQRAESTRGVTNRTSSRWRAPHVALLTVRGIKLSISTERAKPLCPPTTRTTDRAALKAIVTSLKFIISIIALLASGEVYRSISAYSLSGRLLFLDKRYDRSKAVYIGT